LTFAGGLGSRDETVEFAFASAGGLRQFGSSRREQGDSTVVSASRSDERAAKAQWREKLRKTTWECSYHVEFMSNEALPGRQAGSIASCQPFSARSAVRSIEKASDNAIPHC
jgi:hypothetical protein